MGTPHEREAEAILRELEAVEILEGTATAALDALQRQLDEIETLARLADKEERNAR